ncbi:MAG: hypothetical protein PHH28_04375 [Desulfuromonadaceae bacterium]|nr:hypothetical protein [Desulfuromonadaceae bacterium]
MKNTILIAALVLFICACTAPQSSQAAALGRDQDAEQLWAMDRELTLNIINDPDQSQDQRRGRAVIKQNDLLHELLTTEDFRYASAPATANIKTVQRNHFKNKEPEARILEDLLVEPSFQNE